MQDIERRKVLEATFGRPGEALGHLEGRAVQVHHERLIVNAGNVARNLKLVRSGNKYLNFMPLSRLARRQFRYELRDGLLVAEFLGGVSKRRDAQRPA